MIKNRFYLIQTVTIVLVFLLCAFPCIGKEKQKQDDIFRWEFSLGGTAYYVSRSNNWNFGPELTIRYALSKTMGVYGIVSYPSVRMTSRGYGFREGFPFDLGVWISPRHVRPFLWLGIGFSHLWGSDADGSLIRGSGPHILAQASYWFNRHMGLWVRGVLRYWLTEDNYDSRFSPGFSAGLGLRF